MLAALVLRDSADGGIPAADAAGPEELFLIKSVQLTDL
jgi:hypothetical protein